MQTRSVVRALARPLDWQQGAAAGRQALAWWLGGLGSLIPDGFRRRIISLRRIPPTLILGRSSMCLVDGIDHRIAGQTEGHHDLDAMATTLATWSRNSSLPNRVIILLEKELVVSREITLPIAAAGSLSAIVRHQVPKLVPMATEDIASTHTIIRRRQIDKTMAVRVTLVKRTTIAWARSLAVQANLTVPRIIARDIFGNRSTVWRDETPGSHRLIGALGRHQKVLVVVVLLFLAAFTQFVRIHAGDGNLLRQVTNIKAQAASTMALSRQLGIDRERAAYLHQRTDELSAGAVLVDLSRLLPMDTWLWLFTYQRGVVTCSGRAAHAATLIGLIENSAVFANPRFTSATTLSADGNGEVFEITFVVRQSAALQ